MDNMGLMAIMVVVNLLVFVFSIAMPIHLAKFVIKPEDMRQKVMYCVIYPVIAASLISLLYACVYGGLHSNSYFGVIRWVYFSILRFLLLYLIITLIKVKVPKKLAEITLPAQSKYLSFGEYHATCHTKAMKENITLDNRPMYNFKITRNMANKIGKIVMIVVILVIAYLFALGNRYIPLIDGKIIYDTWNNTAFDVTEVYRH